MTKTFTSAAFYAVAPDASRYAPFAVTLYVSTPFYGGPEEGGWWGRDVSMVAWRKYSTWEQAEQAAEKMEDVAKDMAKNATRAHGEQCQSEMDWCDARGVDYDYLPEPDGPAEYFIRVEPVDAVGREESRGSRHWE